MLRSRFIFDVLLPSLVLCWAAILIYSAIASDTGYRALAQLNAEAATKEANLEALTARRVALEKQADLLASDALDPDMIDERIRRVLGYSQKGDVVVPRGELRALVITQD